MHGAYMMQWIWHHEQILNIINIVKLGQVKTTAIQLLNDPSMTCNAPVQYMLTSDNHWIKHEAPQSQ